MPLAKQNIPLPLTRGIDKSTADQLRSPESLSEGINCEQLKTGEVTKRKGFATTATASDIVGRALYPFEQSVSILGSYNGIVSGTSDTTMDVLLYGESSFSRLTSEISAGEVVCEVKNLPNATNTTNSLTDYACLVSSDFLYIARPDATVAKYDRDLNYVSQGLSSLTEVTSAGKYFISKLGTNLRASDAPAGTVSAYTNFLTSALGGSNRWNICPLSSGKFAIAWDNGTNVQVHVYSSTFTSLGSVVLSNANLKLIHLFQVPSQNEFYVVLGRTNAAALANRFEAYRYNETPTLQYTLTLSGTSDVHEAYQVCGIEINSTKSAIFFEFDPASGSGAGNTYEREVGQWTVSNTSTGSGNIFLTGTALFRAGLASKPFVVNGDVAHVLVSYQGTDGPRLQNCIFVINSELDIAARTQYGLNKDMISGNLSYFLPDVPSWSDGTSVTALFNKISVDTSSPLAASQYEYNLIAFEAYTETTYEGSKLAKLGSTTLFAHGGLYSAVYNEIVGLFHELYPDPPALSETTGGALTTTGTYSYVVTYSFTDENGNVIESAPSFPATITLTGSNNRVNVQLNPAGFGAGKNVTAIIYRTVNSGTTYYAVEELAAPTVLTTHQDGDSDSNIIDNLLLYTTGGVAENITPSNTYFIAAAKNRFWTFERGSRDKLWFSKKPSLGRIPAFSDLQIVNIPSQGGILVGVAQIDDKLIVFKRERVFVIFGDGPTDNLQGSFSEPTAIVQGIGCVNARSIIETPQGVFYQAQEGIYLIDRSLQNIFIGRPLYKDEGQLLTSGYDATFNRVFFLAGSIIWVYYITTGSWYEWTIPECVDLSVSNDSVYLLKSDAEILKLGSAYQDDGANYAQTIKLGQFQFSGIQGYQRVYRMLCTGKDNGDAGSDTVTVNTFINSNTTATDTFTATHSDLILGNRFELEVRPSIQKCESLELQITTTSSTSGITLAVVSAEVGGYAGSGRRSSQARAT